MGTLTLHSNGLGFEIHDDGRLRALYRATEELARVESPKPCFAPLYTPSGGLITEYRPQDHLWHTGLYFGWVHVNGANLWGGPWYVPEAGQYELVEGTHGMQRHEAFERLEAGVDAIMVDERLTWVGADDAPLAVERRAWEVTDLPSPRGYQYRVRSHLEPAAGRLTLGASRAARYSGFELRLGPPFADAQHACSEGRTGHEAIMGQRARWVSAAGAHGGAVVMMDHPDNPRHPVTWFTRRNLLGAGLLMEGDLELESGNALDLEYALVVLDEVPTNATVEELFTRFAG